MKKVLLFFILNFLLTLSLSAQVEFSLGTGFSGLRNFSPDQKFWAFGQTVRTNFHFSPTQSAYAWLDYYSEGTYRNNFTAITKPPFFTPLQIPFTATGRLTYRHFSLGWKHYFRGSYEAERGVNLYGMAGFGFLFARIRNQFSQDIDLSRYFVPTQPTAGVNFRKLTFDLGIGGELPLGGGFYAVADARTWLPASSKTSPYLHSQRNVPLPVIASIGLRVLFGLRY
jgi:hypothetical protein